MPTDRPPRGTYRTPEQNIESAQAALTKAGELLDRPVDIDHGINVARAGRVRTWTAIGHAYAALAAAQYAAETPHLRYAQREEDAPPTPWRLGDRLNPPAYPDAFDGG